MYMVMHMDAEYDMQSTQSGYGVAASSDFSRRLFDRCQRRLGGLMPYRYIMWESAESLNLTPDSKILSVNGAGNFGRFISEKKLFPSELRSIDYYSGSISPTESLPFSSKHFDRIFVDTLGPEINRIFFVNELKRVIRPEGTIVLIDKKTGIRAAWRQLADHLGRIRNIRGTRRRVVALAKAAYTSPFLWLNALLDRSLAAPISIRTLTNNGVAFDIKRDKIGNRILIGAIKAKQTTDPLVAAFTDYSKKFDLRYPVIDPPSKQIVNVTLDELKKNPVFLDELTMSYQKIFGSSEIWAEGAFCNLNPKHMISLEEYNNRLAADDLKCACGGVFKPCYTKNYFEQLITRKLTKDRHYNPYCGLYMPGGEVTGFLWGAVSTLDDAVKRILATPNWVDKSEWHTFVDCAREKLIADFGVNAKDKIFYLDDLGIRREERKGIDPMMLLTGQAFSHAVINGCQQALCWTSKKGPLYKISLSCAFKEVVADSDGKVFMYCADIVPTLRILQRGPRSILPIMVRNAKARAALFPETVV